MKSGGSGEKNLKLDESCISNPKSEMGNWTVGCGPILYFGFRIEMQDSSNFKFSYQPLHAITGQKLRRVGRSIP
jgi:hypothetical protein